MIQMQVMKIVIRQDQVADVAAQFKSGAPAQPLFPDRSSPRRLQQVRSRPQQAPRYCYERRNSWHDQGQLVGPGSIIFMGAFESSDEPNDTLVLYKQATSPI